MNKLKQIFQLIFASNYAVVLVSKKRVSTFTHTGSELEDNMLLAVTIQKTFDALTAEIEKKAVDAGEVKTLESLKSVVATIDGQTK
jgi:serine phosphatase RsbU (regulator of sigma subunit)